MDAHSGSGYASGPIDHANAESALVATCPARGRVVNSRRHLTLAKRPIGRSAFQHELPTQQPLGRGRSQGSRRSLPPGLGKQPFDLVGVDWDVLGELLQAVGRDPVIVLDSDAKPLGRDVEAWLDGEDLAGSQGLGRVAD